MERKTLYHNREAPVSLLVSSSHVILDVIRPGDFSPVLRSVLNGVTEASGWLIVIYGLNRTCLTVRSEQSRLLRLRSRCYHLQVTNAQHILRYSDVPDSPVVSRYTQQGLHLTTYFPFPFPFPLGCTTTCGAPFSFL